MDLNEARDIINRADEQIVAALKERMRAVTEVARYKQAHNLPVLDEKREEKVLERVAAMAGDDMSGLARELYRHIMALSRDYQTKMLGRDGKIRLLVLNGPNLNMLGIREPNIYGKKTYADLTAYIRAEAEKLDADVEIFQSNHEGALVEKIQSALHHFDGIVINPAAYTHTSVAILDALKAVALPAVEVHLSDVSAREAFRQVSYAGMACEKTYAGHGFESYRLAMEYLCRREEKHD